MKRNLAVILACMLSLSACGSGAGTQQSAAPAASETVQAETAAAETSSAETAAETASTDAAEPDSSTEAAAQDSSFDEAAQGNYIDEAGNHLAIYYMKKEDGYEKDGWAAMAVFGEEIQSGELMEEGGALSGELSIFNGDGTPGAAYKVTLTKEDGGILMQTEKGDAYHFVWDDTDYAALAGEMLPMFQYNQLYAYRGFDNVAAAAYDYLSFDYRKDYDPSNVLIPYVRIIAMEESDPKDVLMYGDYWLFEFAREDDVLTAVSGGHCPGIIHAERFGDAGNGIYSANSMEEALTDQDAERLFGDHYKEFERVASDDAARDAGLAQVIADYVSANDLPVTKYRIAGEDPKELPESNAGKPHQKIDLPAFVCADPASQEAAVYSWLIDHYRDDLGADEYDTTIPYAVFLDKDESDPEDIKILMDGWVMCYNLEDEVLEMQSGIGFSGAAHLKKTADGYEVTSFEDVMDGDDYDASARKIFGSHYEDFLNLSEDEKQEARKKTIREYVSKTGLSVAAYKDFDEDPVKL